MPTHIAISHTAAHPALGARPAPLARRIAALRAHGADAALLAVIAGVAALGIAAMADTLATPVTLDAIAGLIGVAGL